MFNGVEMDVIQMDIIIILVPDDMVPESPLPDHDMAWDLLRLFITIREPEFDGLHDFGNGRFFIGVGPWDQVARFACNLTYAVGFGFEIRGNRRTGARQIDHPVKMVIQNDETDDGNAGGVRHFG